MSLLASLVSRESFVRAAKSGLRCRTHTLLVQAHPLEPAMLSSSANNIPVWTGFTATRKLGGAVVRNRAKRRMRAVARHHLDAMRHCGLYFVFIAREGLLVSDHARLQQDMAYAIRRLTREYAQHSVGAGPA